MTRLRRRVWHWPLWLLIASAPGAVAQPDRQPPSTSPTQIEVPAPNGASADQLPDKQPPDSEPFDKEPSDGALLREPAAPSSTNNRDDNDEFKPTPDMEISEDFSIPLPVDI